LVGGIKLHFPKAEPVDEEQANLVWAMMNAFCKDHLWRTDNDALHGDRFGKRQDLPRGQDIQGTIEGSRKRLHAGRVALAGVSPNSKKYGLSATGGLLGMR
jgi:hypothetical protein